MTDNAQYFSQTQPYTPDIGVNLILHDTVLKSIVAGIVVPVGKPLNINIFNSKASYE